MDDGIGIAAVIREHVIGDHRVWSELVCSGGIAAQPCGLVVIGTVGIKSKLVELSQTGANVEWS